MSALAQLETELAGLYASPPGPLPFAPSLHARAFLLRREAENLLVYSNDGLRSALTGAADTRRRIDAIIERVRRGESG